MKLLKLSGYPHTRAIQTIARFSGLSVFDIVHGIIYGRARVLDNRRKAAYINERGW